MSNTTRRCLQMTHPRWPTILSSALSALTLVACAPRLPANTLHCEGALRSCSLRQGAHLQGIQLGMNRQEVFRQACSGRLSSALSNPYYTTYSTRVEPQEITRESLKRGPASCADAALAARHDFWEFDSQFGVCWFPRRETTTMRFVDDRLTRVEIGCGTIDF